MTVIVSGCVVEIEKIKNEVQTNVRTVKTLEAWMRTSLLYSMEPNLKTVKRLELEILF